MSSQRNTLVRTASCHEQYRLEAGRTILAYSVFKMWVKRNWFVIGLFVAIAVGLLLAQLDADLNPGGWTNRIIVIALFFIAGVKLPTERILQDLTNWRLHLFIQLSVFVVSPLYFLTAGWLFSDAFDGQLLVGFYALAVLPTTISTGVVLTQSSGGNGVAALFNAALANVAGIIVSPLLLSLLLSSSGRALPTDELAGVLRSLALNMLLPVLLGQLVRNRAREVAVRWGKHLGNLSNLLILLIVVLSFVGVGGDPRFSRIGGELILPGLYVMVSHLILLALAWAGGKALKLGDRDLIATLFLAPQKTLALGAPLLAIYFAGQDVLGYALLPLIMYHPWQILVAGIVKGLPLMKRYTE